MSGRTPTAEDIASRLGLRKYPRSWRGRCPACEYAGNTLSVRVGPTSPRLYCANGCDHATLTEAVANRIGGVSALQPERKPHNDAEAARRKQERALALWRGSEPILGSPAERYLQSRFLPELAQSAALKFRADCPHPEGGTLPALIALVTAPDGQPCAIHRTYLLPNGSGKANAIPPKASLGPVWRSVIRLYEAGAELVIGEGIESAAAAGILLGLPAWAAISAGNMAREMVLPEMVRTVTIAMDRDPAGEGAADNAARRWRAEGRQVRLMIPNHPGQDANDILGARAVAHG